MAIYHLNLKVGSRSGGQSARAKSEYIEREGKYEKDSEELEYRESGNMPGWAEDDPRQYWAAADEHERANGRLFVQVECSLPKELNEQGAAEAGPGLRRRADRPGAIALHVGNPQGRRGESPHPPDDFRARPGRSRPGRRAVVQAGQHQGTREGRGKENQPVEQGMAGRHPAAVGDSREPGP